MKVSMKSEYGVRALVDLAHQYGEGTISSQVIARRHSIPQPFLDQLMAILRRAGLVRSVRGPHGGHALIRAPDDIRLSEAIAALDGSLAPVSCLDDLGMCPLGSHCVLQPVWAEVLEATTSMLAGLTIADLVDRERFGIPSHYSI
jgi:Rrf2 family protein